VLLARVCVGEEGLLRVQLPKTKMDHKRPAGQQGGPSGAGPGGGPPRKRPQTEEDYMIDESIDDFEDGMLPPDEDAGEVDLGVAGRNWMRPPVEAFDQASTSLGAQHACMATASMAQHG
jgi:hypothetical protein